MRFTFFCLVAFSWCAFARAHSCRWSYEVKEPGRPKKTVSLGDTGERVSGLPEGWTCDISQVFRFPSMFDGEDFRMVNCEGKAGNVPRTVRCVEGEPKPHTEVHLLTGAVPLEVRRAPLPGKPKPIVIPADKWAGFPLSNPTGSRFAGLKPGDAILEWEGFPIERYVYDLGWLIGSLTEKSKDRAVTILVRRDGKPITVTLPAVEALPLKLEADLSPNTPAARTVVIVLINPSPIPVGWGEYNCSWAENWRTDAKEIRVAQASCFRNFGIRKVIEGNSRLARQLELAVDTKARGKKKFHLIFSPNGYAAMTSNELEITF